jgi:hypothetical protein
MIEALAVAEDVTEGEEVPRRRTTIEHVEKFCSSLRVPRNWRAQH